MVSKIDDGRLIRPPNIERLLTKLILPHLPNHMSRRDIHSGSRLMDDLGLDSLDLVEFTMAIEAEFGIEIDDETAETVRTMSDAIKLVTKLTGGLDA